MANVPFAQAEEHWPSGKTAESCNPRRPPAELVPHRTIRRANRPSTSSGHGALTPERWGSSLPCTSTGLHAGGDLADRFILQWGVELGKVLSARIVPELEAAARARAGSTRSGPTNTLIRRYRKAETSERRRAVGRMPFSRSCSAQSTAYWRAANYLSVGQIIISSTIPFCKRAAGALGHQAHCCSATGARPRAELHLCPLNRIIKKYDLDMIMSPGPGTRRPGVVTTLEADTYPRRHVQRDLIRHFRPLTRQAFGSFSPVLVSRRNTQPRIRRGGPGPLTREA